MRQPAPPIVSRGPGRRSVLLTAVGVLTVSLTGCAVRLEDDAPAIPLIPTREPVPAEEALLWLLADSRRLSLSATSGTPTEGSGTSSDTSDLYEEQVAVLRSALHRAGVPIETLDAAIVGAAEGPTEPPTTPATTTAPTTTAPTTGEPDEVPSPGATPPPWPGAALDRIEDLRQCGPGMFPLVMSLLAQRWAAVAAAGDPLPEPMVEDRSARIWRFPALAREFAVLTQPAVYGLEVVSAQAGDTSREPALEALGTLRLLGREQDVRAGGSTPRPEIGYPLPFPVDSEESATALARHVLGTLVDGYGGLLPTVTGSAQEDTARDVVTWIGSVSALGRTWGLPPQAFPGTLPGS